MGLPQKLPYDLMLTNWATQLDPLIKSPINQGNLVTNVKIKTGVNVINHKLSRKQVGYFIADITGPALLYRTADFNNLTLTLTSTGDCMISLWVF